MTNYEKTLLEDLQQREYELRKIRRDYQELQEKYNAAKEIIKQYGKLI